jgi:hypothetical protein
MRTELRIYQLVSGTKWVFNFVAYYPILIAAVYDVGLCMPDDTDRRAARG